MDRRHREGGYTKISKLVILLFLVAGGYVGVAFWPPGSTYYRLRGDAKQLANRALQANRTVIQQQVQSLVRRAYDREGINLHRSDINVDTTNPDAVEVSIHLTIPYEYPLIGKKRLWTTRIEVRSERIRGF